MGEIGVYTIKRFLKTMGANRISNDAALEIAEYVDKELGKIIKTAIELSKNSGRTTITEEDVRFAIRTFRH